MSYILLRIGRKEDNDIVLKHNSVSGHHAEIFVNEDGIVFLTDLQSTNGTFVNGNRISGAVLLKKGDILKLGVEKAVPWLKWIEEKQKEMSQPVANPVTNPEIEIQASRTGNRYTKELIWGGIILVLLFIISLLIYNNSFSNQGILMPTTDSVSADSSPDPISSGSDPKINVHQDRGSIQYDYSCMKDDLLVLGNDLKNEVLDAYGREVDLDHEISTGDQLHDEIESQYTIITSGSSYNHLVGIFNQLIHNIYEPRGLFYKIYLIESSELNAFTCGGRVYVTTKMYSFCKNDHELACVLGHEIYHNELGHIRQSIRQSSLDGSGLLGLITTSFDQKNEVECDLHGIDLAAYSGYDPCAAVYFWKRMQAYDDNKNEDIEKFFRSHPFGSTRTSCSRNHIDKNYSHDCL